MKGSASKTIAISVDVENDWGGRVDTSYGIQEGLPFILDTLDEFAIRATFFICGEVVTKNRAMVCRISKSGHEIASHGFTHNIDYGRLSEEELSDQIHRSKLLIEEETGTRIVGFRMPKFRVNDCLFHVLADLRFKYDSSVVRGILPWRYSNLSIPYEPFLKNGILEIPVSTMPYLRVPMGLLWINAVGFNTFRFLMERSKLPHTIVLYIHPFDLIVDKPEGDFGFFVNRWHNYKATSPKATLVSIVEYFKDRNERFVSLEDILP